jgi:hypothetical protein
MNLQYVLSLANVYSLHVMELEKVVSEWNNELLLTHAISLHKFRPNTSSHWCLTCSLLYIISVHSLFLYYNEVRTCINVSLKWNSFVVNKAKTTFQGTEEFIVPDEHWKRWKIQVVARQTVTFHIICEATETRYYWGRLQIQWFCIALQKYQDIHFLAGGCCKSHVCHLIGRCHFIIHNTRFHFHWLHCSTNTVF